MRALTVVPLQKGSAEVTDVPEPEPGEGDLLVDGVALGICGTAIEIVGGEYGWAPPGQGSLSLGHEALGRVRGGRAGAGFSCGGPDVGGGRHPDPLPSGRCARGASDLAPNGRHPA